MIAALPMYDWPEVSAETDLEWVGIRRQLEAQGVAAPLSLTRRNLDLPGVPGGILDADGRTIAPDPHTLHPDELNVHVLWRHPDLLFAQTCWGPMELGLAQHVRVVGQPDYSAYQGGDGVFYRSAIVERRRHGLGDEAVPDHDGAGFDIEALRGRRFAFNGEESMSGYLALWRDLAEGQALGARSDFSGFWSAMTCSGGHRESVISVAESRADIAAVDCRSLDLCRRFEPAMAELRIAGWTSKRKGLPYITSLRNTQLINLSSHG